VEGVADRPHPPGEYPVVVVGSGPGGLQTSYFLSRLGVPHALISQDERPGGMFRLWPIFERLLSWSEPEAAVARDTEEYELYDQNSLLADEPEARATAAEVLRDGPRTHIVPTRAEMEAGLTLFAERARVDVRFRCTWEATRREGDGSLVLTTSDGEYRCRAAVFALGVTEPWKSPIEGIDAVPHYADAERERARYANRDVVVIGKRNSAFEVADGLEPWARRLILLSPRPTDTSVIALSSVRVRYMQPLEHHQVGGGTWALDASIERIERASDRFRVHAQGTTRPGPIVVEADDVIAATGFRTPLRDLADLGVATVAQGRIPALTPYWESATAPGIFFAGNASQGAAGLRRHGVGSSSPAVHGFRYNARVLARHLARQLGYDVPAERVEGDPVRALLTTLSTSSEIWTQKAYLARVLAADGTLESQPLAHFVDSAGPDAVAATIEMNAAGEVYPVVYRRRGGEVTEHVLEPRPLRDYDRSEGHRRELEALLSALNASA
jgi:thioredoxin reductase